MRRVSGTTRARITRLLALVAGQLPLLCAMASEAGAVPSPFEPVTTVETEEGLMVHVWGRRYRFVAGPFPASVASQGIELMTAPPEIRLGGSGGAVQTLEFGPIGVIERSPEVVRLKSTAEVDGIRIDATSRIEYDGMIRVRLELAPAERTTIDSFSYRFELPSDSVRWFNHHVPYDYADQNIDKIALLESAGVIPDGTRRFAFAPTFFVGGRKVGLELWWETDARWSRRRERPPIDLQRDASNTRLTVSPITEPTKVRPSRPWIHELALFPTPLRPPPEHWRSNRFVSYQVVDQMTRRPDLHYYWIAFPKHFDALYHGLPGSRRSKRQRDLRRRLARLDIGYIPYAKLTAAPSGHPKTVAMSERWRANDQILKVPLPDERALLEANTDWRPGRIYSYPVCTEQSDYLDWIREQSIAALRSERLDGLYYDFGSITRMCERAAARSSASVSRGRTPPEFWFYFNVREFYKRLYEQMHENEPAGLLTIHTHGQPRALSAWADYAFIGEALNVYFRGDASLAEIERRPRRYRPDYLALPDGWMDAMTFPATGGVTSWLPELKWAADPGEPGRLEAFQRGLLAWVLVNDVHMWLGNGDFDRLAEVYRALDAFGSLDDARVHAWWADGGPVRDAGRLKVTSFARPDAMLLVVSNLTDRPAQARLRLDSAALSTGVPARFRDLERDVPEEWTAIGEGGIDLSVGSRDFRLILAVP